MQVELVDRDRALHPRAFVQLVYPAPAPYRAERQRFWFLKPRVVSRFARLTMQDPSGIGIHHKPTSPHGGSGGSKSGPSAWELDLETKALLFTQGDYNAALESLPHSDRNLIRDWRYQVTYAQEVLLKRFDDTISVELNEWAASWSGLEQPGELIRVRRVVKQSMKCPLFRHGLLTDHGVAYSRLLTALIFQLGRDAQIMPLAMMGDAPRQGRLPISPRREVGA